MRGPLLAHQPANGRGMRRQTVIAQGGRKLRLIPVSVLEKLRESHARNPASRQGSCQGPYMPNARLHIFGPDGTHASLRNVLEYNQSAETFPVRFHEMASSKNIQAVRESQVIIWDAAGVRVMESPFEAQEDAVLMHIHKSYAHPGGVFVYRITWRGKSVVYATDTEGYVGTDRRLVKFAQKADVLIHDAQYLENHYRGQLAGYPATQGYGHSTAWMACEVAAASEVRQLILFHHDPSYSDTVISGLEASAQKKFASVCAAYEGLEILFHETNKTARKLQSPTQPREVKYAHYDSDTKVKG